MNVHINKVPSIDKGLIAYVEGLTAAGSTYSAVAGDRRLPWQLLAKVVSRIEESLGPVPDVLTAQRMQRVLDAARERSGFFIMPLDVGRGPDALARFVVVPATRQNNQLPVGEGLIAYVEVVTAAGPTYFAVTGDAGLHRQLVGNVVRRIEESLGPVPLALGDAIQGTLETNREESGFFMETADLEFHRGHKVQIVVVRNTRVDDA